jgi:hypothetical protein
MATRRGFTQQSLVAGGVLGLSGLRAEETSAPHATDREFGMNLGIIVFPRMDQIDFTGPFEVLSRMPGADKTFSAPGPCPSGWSEALARSRSRGEPDLQRPAHSANLGPAFPP